MALMMTGAVMVGGIITAALVSRADPGFVHNGALAGLVAVCAGSDLFHPIGALAVGGRHGNRGRHRYQVCAAADPSATSPPRLPAHEARSALLETIRFPRLVLPVSAGAPEGARRALAFIKETAT